MKFTRTARNLGLPIKVQRTPLLESGFLPDKGSV